MQPIMQIVMVSIHNAPIRSPKFVMTHQKNAYAGEGMVMCLNPQPKNACSPAGAGESTTRFALHQLMNNPAKIGLALQVMKQILKRNVFYAAEDQYLAVTAGME